MSKIETFSFGDPEEVLDGRGHLLDLPQSSWNGSYYEPPVSHDGLAKTLGANAHHASAIQFKVNQVAKHYIAHDLLAVAEFRKLVQDYLIFGNAYLEKQTSRGGAVIKLRTSPAKYTRRTRDSFLFMMPNAQEHHFAKQTVCHIIDPDVSQEIYGLPSYLAALQSVWLNEAATLFRRKYYKNGSHAGFVMYLTDPTHKPEEIEAMRQALKDSKGPGNFRNMFVYSPNGKKDGLQIIPISEVMAKDEFLNIKNISRDDVLAAHRMPPQLMGIIPSNAGGFGSVKEASEIFTQNEIMPLFPTLTAINDWLGQEVITFQQPNAES